MMKCQSCVFVLMVAGLLVPGLLAQEMPEPSAATPQHEFLKKFVGEWELVSEGSGIQAESVMKSSMLGNLWLVNSLDMEMQGMKMQGIQMIGYNTEKEKYVGTWADSMMNHLWHYEGTVDESGKKLTLEAVGPSMSGDGSTANYRDAYEFTDDNTIVATSSVQGDDGKWTVFMTGTGKRK